MHQVLEQHIRAKLGTDTAGLEEVISYFQPLELKRNDYLLREGELCRSCYFIVNGVIQVFTIDAVGNETTRDFILEEHWLMEINSFLQQIPSKEFFRAAEPSQVLHISREHFMDLSARFPQFEKCIDKYSSFLMLTQYIVSIVLYRWMHWNGCVG